MQITSNTTAMLADLTIPTDKEGRNTCVTVIKGTFIVEANGLARLANDQEPLAYADVHWGEAAETSIRYECDFAPFKPKTDVIVVGEALPSKGEAVTEMQVAVLIGGVEKVLHVVGDRTWEQGAMGLRPTPPVPFTAMPVVFERSFGGTDTSHADINRRGAEMRNPIGVGYHTNVAIESIVGTRLPNIEHPRRRYGKWSDRIDPVGFASVGRGWQPRVTYAGTYDERWMNDRCPFLPEDFDQRYFQCAPTDQQVPHVSGGEIIQCLNMSPSGDFIFEVPSLDLPVTFRFDDRDVGVRPILDTIVVEPGRRRCLLTWRASTPLGRKMNMLREVLIGRPSPRRPPRTFKRHFASLAELVAWMRESESEPSATRPVDQT